MNLPVGIQLAIAVFASAFVTWLICRTRGGGQKVDLSSVLNRLDVLEKGNERTERSVKDEIARQREEIAGQSRALREELSASLKHAGDSTVNSLGEIGKAQCGQMEMIFFTWLCRRVSRLLSASCPNARSLPKRRAGSPVHFSLRSTPKLMFNPRRIRASDAMISLPCGS